MGKPPPFRALPERKRAFPYDVFPYTIVLTHVNVLAYVMVLAHVNVLTRFMVL